MKYDWYMMYLLLILCMIKWIYDDWIWYDDIYDVLKFLIHDIYKKFEWLFDMLYWNQYITLVIINWDLQCCYDIDCIIMWCDLILLYLILCIIYWYVKYIFMIWIYLWWIWKCNNVELINCVNLNVLWKYIFEWFDCLMNMIVDNMLNYDMKYYMMWLWLNMNVMMINDYFNDYK